ncbi:Methionine--tRNA ligase, mitochondrial [Eumeta japonica]|uniref:Methionine--tRNA ligase, mitochondrial n=1 Tax=Eumeta variegata TaxID=151549 RepID=A0A4C1ZLD7_EUMVA|nr:Methionine--tRNA ligase, mitochondrial [Eumeta japonica]
MLDQTASANAVVGWRRHVTNSNSAPRSGFALTIFIEQSGHLLTNNTLCSPHIGHLYTAIVADAIQRFESLTKDDCNIIFSTGTDEHGIKIQQAATQANLPLPEYCTQVSNEYQKMFRDFNVNYTEFVRTTEDKHKKAVHAFWNKLKSKDYIYKSRYSGWYSINDETFVPESHVKDEIRNGEKIKVSSESGHIVEWTEETNYMFRLSAFKIHLRNWLRTDGVIKPSKYQKQLQEFLDGDQYFPDISISRPSSRVHWAFRGKEITAKAYHRMKYEEENRMEKLTDVRLRTARAVPDDNDQSIYVWLDALINYLTAIGYPDDEVQRGRPWPADVQVVGKDILKFHGIYWPAFLMAVGRSPPRRLLCHAHWTVDSVKMSKSLGNVVAPGSTPGGMEALRYFLLREGTMHSDANYSEVKLVRTINAELADTLGNLLSRCTGRALNPRCELPPPPRAEHLRHEHTAPLCERLITLPDTCYNYYSNYQFYKVVDAVIQTLHLANLFFESHKPWELRKRIECQTQLDAVLHITMETLRVCGIILQPIIPEMSKKLLDKLSVPLDCRSWSYCEELSWRTGAIPEIKRLSPENLVLFQRIYSDKVHKKKASLQS